MGTLYDTKNIDFTNQPLFFGKERNIQRFDDSKYSWMLKMGERMRSLFWIPQEISLIKDRSDYKNKLNEAEKWILSKNLSRQIVLDSVQGRSPILTFGQLTNLPEFENCLLNWTYFEGAIHSESYTYILQNAYDDIKQEFDSILEDEMITRHSLTITKEYNDLYELSLKFSIDGEVTDELKRAVALALVSVNILEGIRFYVSFACSFSLAENSLMTGSAQILRMIARDENQHLAFTQKLINTLKKETSEGFVEIFEELEDQIIGMYKAAVEEECEWASYLFKHGSVVGLNDAILESYVRYLANQRMRAIGLPALYDETKSPLPWMQKWLTESKVEGAPQEQEIVDYKKGAIDTTQEADYNF